MASTLLGQVRGGRIGCLLTLITAVLVMGGSITEGGYVYQTHSTQQSPNTARQRHVALRLGDGRVGIFAGFGRSDVVMFDPNGESFTTGKATVMFDDFAGVTLPDGSALLIDGEHDGIFDYPTEQFTAARQVYTGGSVRFPVLVPLPDGRIFISGGWDAAFEPKRACGVFDPRRVQFQGMGDLAVPRALHTAVLVDDRQVLIAGGTGYTDNPFQQVALDALELLDTSSGRSGRIRTVLQQARYSHNAVTLPDGRVLILGGTHSDTDHWLHSTEIFDARTSSITAGPSLGLGRSGAQVAVLPSGRIAVFGGNYDARAIEVYCPDTGTFELADSLMLEPRWSEFTATSLESGAVLLVGGRVNEGTEVIRNAEIFEELPTETPSTPALMLAAIRQALTDPDPDVVTRTTNWLVALGPQANPILNTLAQDESSEVRRQAGGILMSIETRAYPQTWCVEIWDVSGRLDTVWLENFDGPDSYIAANPPAHLTAIQRATAQASFTHLVVRFPMHAPYEARVKLFNLVGWTRVPSVVLGEPLREDELARVMAPAAK